MTDTTEQKGLIPHGLVVSNISGEVKGSLTIAGKVKGAKINVDQLTISKTGGLEDGNITSDDIAIDGAVSGVSFVAARLTAGPSAHISDCSITMTNPSGCTIQEGAEFDGDVQISISRRNSAPHQASTVDEDAKTDWYNTPDINEAKNPNADITVG